MGSFLTRQPGKGIWTTFTILSLLIRLPYTAIYYLPRYLRPHPTWTYRQSFGNAICKLWIQYISRVQYRISKSLKPDNEKERFVLMDPKDNQNLFHGPTKSSSIKPVTIGGIWYPSLYTPDSDSDKKIVLHFHGGAYVHGGARPAECGFGIGMLIKTNPSTMVFCPQYRLACYPNSHFPAALQDAVVSYKYLLDQGISASRIILSGDSAGGNLALTLLRYLVEEADAHRLPPPVGVFAWSPWVDLAAPPEEIDRNRNSGTDYVTSSLARWGLGSFIPASVPRSDPYISPAHNLFTTEIPIFIQVGGVEILHDEITTFAEKMKKIPGNRVEIFVTPFAPHDIVFCGHILGWVKEAEEAALAAWTFLESQES